MMNAVLDVADNWLGLTRVELTVFADNERAIRLYQGCGFETEGRFRRYAMRDGVLVDALAMARLRTG
jgi:putative acetyltransferase